MTDPRTFLDWNRPALPAAAALLADTYTHEGSLELGNVLIGLPGARAARRLKELLVEEADRRGLRLVPPRIATPGSLPESLYAPTAPFLDPGTGIRLWLQQLRGAAPEDLMLLFPHAPHADEVRGWLHLARTVRTLHETVGAAGRTFADVAETCDDSLLYDDTNRWSALARLQAGYAAAAERSQRVDRDLERIRAVQRAAIRCDQDLWLIGTAEMPLVLRSMLRLLARSRPDGVRILIHAPASEADRFDDLGCVVPRAWLDADIPLHDDQLSITGHPSNQATEVGRYLASLGAEFAADEIVIGVPDREVVPFIEQQLATSDVKARDAAGTPVARTSAYRLLETIADVVQDHSFEAVAALARHPAFGDWLRRKRWEVEHRGAAAFRESDGWLIHLDEFLSQRLPISLEHDLPGAEGRGRTVVEALRVALTGEAMLGRLRGRRPLREWMPVILELLLEIYGDRAFSRDLPDERRLLGAAEAFRDAALAHVQVTPELDVACGAAAAIRILLDDVRGAALPPEADDAAIELLGWLELHLDDAPVAVLTGMNEPFVPEAINADAFLPNTLRSRLGIIDNDVRHARDAYQLTAMLHSRRVYAVAGRRTMLGDPLRPSRLVLAVSGDTLARRIRTFLDGDADHPDAAADTPASTQSAFVLPPQKIITLEMLPDSFRVTDFRNILADPYLWALDRVVGGDGLDDSARELDPLRFGSVAHGVLERFGVSEAAAWDDADRIAEWLEHALDTYVDEVFGRTLPAVALQVEQLRLRLHSFAQRQAAWIGDGWRTVSVECGTPEAGAPFDVDGTTIRLKGRIDRIDYHEVRNEWALFDYKTSERAESPEDAHRKRGEWTDLQLPLYHAILPHVENATGESLVSGADAAVRVGYITLCGDPADIDFRVAAWSATELGEALDAAREAVRIVRRNVFSFVEVGSGWLSDDMAELLGRGRLVREDEEYSEMEEEVVL
ncbi:MAG: PD-(D/E)XK nuclease family protein [Longimicrobiales bacterium]